MLRATVALSLCLAAPCLSQNTVSGPPAQAPVAASPQPVDTPQATDVTQTSGGARFTVPAGWVVARSENFVSVTAPENDTHIVILEETAPDATAAVTQAWAAYKPGFARKLKNTLLRPDKEGWKDIRVFQYETSPNERAVVEAVAVHAGSQWTVVLLDGTEQTFEKRGAQVSLLMASLRPKDYQRENFAGKQALPLTPERIEQLRSFVEASMKKLDVPGAGFALLSGGKVVYEGGLGVKALGKPEPVDANTLFMAASNTKGMTTLLLAKLVDAGKLRWNEPVTKVYPAFALGDAATTRSVEVRHLVCACTGLPRQDYEWLFQYKKFTPDSTFTLLSNMQPTSKFNEVFQYSNLMASAAGYVGARLYYPTGDLGKAYDTAMQRQIFGPLGMKTTTFDMAQAQRGDFASPHSDDVDGHTGLIPMQQNYSVVPFRPAGGVWVSAHDMTRYALLELNRGKLPDGKQFVSEENLLARRKPQVATGEDETYGMGLEVNRRWGVPVVHHGGSLFGYKSDWMILPDSGMGAVLLTNSDTGGMLIRPVLRRLVEVVFEGKAEAVADVDTAAANFHSSVAKERARLQLPADTAESARLATRYSNPALGGLEVRRTGAELTFAMDGGSSRMASRRNDDGTVSFVMADPPLSGFDFTAAEREGKRVLLVRDGQHEYAFVEVAK